MFRRPDTSNLYDRIYSAEPCREVLCVRLHEFRQPFYSPRPTGKCSVSDRASSDNNSTLLVQVGGSGQSWVAHMVSAGFSSVKLFLLDDCAATTEMDKMEGKLLRECPATKVPEMNEVEGNLLDEQTAPEMAFSII